MTDDSPNRRRFPRIPSGYTVLVREVGGEHLEELAKIRSLGLGGCSFISDEPLEEGVALELVISLDLRPVSVPARVVWTHPGAGGLEIGVEFLSLDHDERTILEDFFNQDLREPEEV